MKENCNFNIQPYDKSQSEERMNHPFGLNYVNQDYWGFKNRMLEHIKQNSSKEFNDFTESSIVVMLIELWAFLADTLSFKIDQVANEMFIDTVTDHSNALRLAKLVGFTPTPPIPAKAMFVGTINSILNQDLRITTPVKIGYDIPGVGFKNMELFAADVNNNPLFGEDIIITGGSLSTTSIVGIEGITKQISLTGAGAPFQIVSLNSKNVLMGSIMVYVDGTLWKPVEYFSNEDSNEEYIIEYSANYDASIIFGDGKGGRVPQKGCIITVVYRQGGGTSGNIVTGAIETVVRVAVPGLSHVVIVNFKNYTKGEFGYDGDNIDDIRRKLPLYLKTQDRAVTAQDYKALAELYASSYNGSIGKAMAALRNHGCAGNIIDLYLLANSGTGTLTKPNTLLLESVAAEIDKKKMLTDYVCVRSGEITYVDITIDIIVSSINRHSESSVKDRVYRRMQLFFSLNNWDFGKNLKESDVIRVLSDIKEIDQVDITFNTVKGLEEGVSHQNVVVVQYNEIIQPDNLVIKFTYR